MDVSTADASSTPIGQKRALDPLVLELQMAVSGHVGAWVTC